MLGNLVLTSPTESSPSASPTSIFDKLGEDVEKLKDKGENAIKDGINNIVDEFAELLGIHDFYSYHLLDYCEVIKSQLINKKKKPKLTSYLPYRASILLLPSITRLSTQGKMSRIAQTRLVFSILTLPTSSKAN